MDAKIDFGNKRPEAILEELNQQFDALTHEMSQPEKMQLQVGLTPQGYSSSEERIREIRQCLHNIRTIRARIRH